MEGAGTERRLNESIDAELTGIIYEAALDPHLWPDLLDMLAQMLNLSEPANQSESALHGNTDGNNRFYRLLPHIHRALALNRRFNDTKQEHQFTNSIIDQFPIGIVIINAERQVISSNRRANEVIHSQLGVSIVNSKFRIDDEKKNEFLTRYIEQLTKKETGNKIDNTCSLAINQQDQATLSLLISTDPYYRAHYDNNAEHRITLFIASPFSQHSVSHDALQSLFQLSPAEARLTASLASGISIDEYALTHHVAKHTARTQLKSIFRKTSTHKQTELIKLVLTSPAVLTALDELQYSRKKNYSYQPSKHLLNETLLTLADGRKLSFCEYGDANGLPVIFFHGILGSRYERHPDDSIINGLGIRLIVPDRPGYGRSDANSRGNHLDFVDDIVQLTDHLKINTFSIFGLSVGAIYAAACAYKVPEKITSAFLLGTTLPLRSFADIADLLPSFKMQYALTKYIPHVARLFPEIAAQNAHSNPAKFFRNMPMSYVDREVFFREELHQHLIDSLLAGGGISHAGFIEDIMSSVQPWSFPIEDVKIKLDFWHGTDDLHSPIRRIYELAETIDNASITPVQGGGHFFIYDYWSDILKAIIRESHNH